MGLFYTIADSSMCYDELVITLNEILNKFCTISKKKYSKLFVIIKVINTIIIY